MHYSKKVVKIIIFCVQLHCISKVCIKWTMLYMSILYSFYSNMYEESSVQFSFWYDLFKVSCFLSKTCSMYPNTFKRWRFVFCIPCTRLQNFVNVSPLLLTALLDLDISQLFPMTQGCVMTLTKGHMAKVTVQTYPNSMSGP